MTSLRTTDAPIDRGWAWLVLLGGVVNTIIYSSIANSYGYLLVFIEERFDSSASASGAILGTMLVTRGIGGALVLMSLPGHLSLRTLIMTGSVIFSAGLLVSSFATSVKFLICSAGFVCGLGAACIYGPNSVVLCQYFDRHRTFAIAMGAAGSSLGQTLLPPFFFLLVNTFAVSGAYLILSALVLNGVVGGAIMRPLSFYSRRSKGGDDVKSKRDLRDNSSRNGLRSLLGTLLRRLKPGLSSDHEDENKSRRALLSENTDRHPGGFYGDAKLRVAPSGSEKSDNDRKDDTVDEAEDWSQQNCAFNKNAFATDETTRLNAGFNTDENISSSYGDNFNETKDTKSFGLKPESKDDGRCPAMMSVLRDKVAMLILLSFGFSTARYISHMTFLPFRARDLGISKQKTAILMTVIGSVPIVSKPIFGMIADTDCLKKQYMICICSTIVAVLTLCIPLFTSYYELLGCVSALGTFDGMLYATGPVLMREQVGLDLLPKALALDIAVQGFAMAFSVTFLGWVRDVTDGYSEIYLVLGGLELASMLMLLTGYIVKNRQEKTHKTNDL